MLFISIALYLLLRDDPSRVAWAGFWLWLGVFNRPSNVVVALPLSICVFVRYRSQIVKFVILGTVPLIVMAWYSTTYLGSIFTLGQTQDVNLFSGDMVQGFFGLLLSPARGLFIFTPLFVFSAAYMLYALFSKMTPSIYKYLAATVIAMIALFAKWYQWWGGASFGYRLLIEAVPMLIIFLALWWGSAIGRRWYFRAAFIAALLVSIYFHFLGAYYYPSGFNFIPGHINVQTWRLWDWHDTELTHLTDIFLRTSGLRPQ